MWSGRTREGPGLRVAEGFELDAVAAALLGGVEGAIDAREDGLAGIAHGGLGDAEAGGEGLGGGQAVEGAADSLGEACRD
jgi:hypothetical protein